MDYTQFFGNTPFALHMAYGDRDREIAAEQQKAALLEEQTKAASLQNMFNEQMNPMKVQQQQMENNYVNQTQPYKITSELADFAKKAKQNEIEGLELEARRMALSNDPAESAEGIRLMGLTKEFFKIREQTAGKVEVENVKGGIRKDVEVVKAKLRPPKVVRAGGGAAAPKPLGMDKLISQYTQQALEAEASGNTALADQLWQRAKAATDMAASRRPDTKAGETRLGPNGLEPTPPRQAPQLPSSRAAPKPSLPAGWTMK